MQIRANYSANADIVLDEKKQVLAIREALVQYDKTTSRSSRSRPSPQTFVKQGRPARPSDGIKVEVLSGVTKTDKIKIPETAGPRGIDGPAARQAAAEEVSRRRLRDRRRSLPSTRAQLG